MAGQGASARLFKRLCNSVQSALAGRAPDRVGFAVYATIGLVVGLGWRQTAAIPVDTAMYWRASSGGPMYGSVWGVDAASRYVYPPPLAQVLAPFHVIGWPAFELLWTIVIFLALWGSTRWASLGVLVVSGASLCAFGFDSALANPLANALVGNIQSVIAVAILLSFRWPAAWAFVLLTKIGPGIGVIWYAARGEWRQFGLAIGATAAIAAVSFAIDPAAWFAFVRFATDNLNTSPPVAVVRIPLVVRIAMSVALTVWGARTDRRWTVPIAAGWASLALYEWSAITVWVAALPLLWRPDVPSRGAAR